MIKESELIGGVGMLTIRRRHGSPGGIPVMIKRENIEGGRVITGRRGLGSLG